jgi:hypothetical protein
MAFCPCSLKPSDFVYFSLCLRVLFDPTSMVTHVLRATQAVAAMLLLCLLLSMPVSKATQACDKESCPDDEASLPGVGSPSTPHSDDPPPPIPRRHKPMSSSEAAEKKARGKRCRALDLEVQNQLKVWPLTVISPRSSRMNRMAMTKQR